MEVKGEAGEKGETFLRKVVGRGGTIHVPKGVVDKHNLKPGEVFLTLRIHSIFDNNMRAKTHSKNMEFTQPMGKTSAITIPYDIRVANHIVYGDWLQMELIRITWV